MIQLINVDPRAKSDLRVRKARRKGPHARFRGARARQHVKIRPEGDARDEGLASFIEHNTLNTRLGRSGR